MTNGYTLRAIRQAISEPRFGPYLREAAGNEESALELYTWSARMTSAAYELIAHVEVFLRNAIDHALSQRYRDAECGIPKRGRQDRFRTGREIEGPFDVT